MSSNGDENSLPFLPPDSPGSSVSSQMQAEYDELLRHAIVMPSYETTPFSLADIRNAGRHEGEQREAIITITAQPRPADDTRDESSDTLVGDTSRGSRVGDTSRGSRVVPPSLPDFRQSPIMRDIYPELTDEEELRSGQSNSSIEQSHTQSSLHHTTEKISVNEHHYVRPAFTSHQSDSTLRSEDSVRDIRHVVLSTSTIDPDVGKMENLLDQWCLDLKRNVLAEYGQSKIRIVELGRLELIKERERHTSEVNNLQNEVEKLKELLHTYEMSVERKDQVISNLTRALQKNKEKVDMMRKFNDWKLCHNDRKREAFASNLARCHYERKLSQKVWAGWHSVIETKWKGRVEKACQSKAQEVCLNLTNEYEAKIAQLTEALDLARQEVSRLHKERDRYEETMKKAFMRGVCALNLEAMSIFQGGEENGAAEATEEGHQVDEYTSSNFESSLPQKDYSAPKTIPQEAVYREAPQQTRPPPRVVGAASHPISGKTATTTHERASSARTVGKTKTVSTRITSKINTGVGKISSGPDNPTLAPPMSTVMVERHQPVVKQTVGHATASKYPVKKDSIVAGCSGVRQSSVVHRRIAGQSGTVASRSQGVKIVD